MKDASLFAFFGTSSFVVPALEVLEQEGMAPALVITAPDRPSGRGMRVTPSPVKAWAMARGIDVMTPEKLKDEQFLAELKNTEWDFFLVASYGKILPRAVLDIPRHGCINIHPSLLPRFRGPSPVLSAILADERETGVTVIKMAEAMDAGPILAQARVAVDEPEWPPKGDLLTQMLFVEGARLVVEILPDYLAGALTPEPQDDSKATYTKKFTTEDSLVNPEGGREDFLKIRAFDKTPRAHFIAESGERIVVTEAAWVDNKLEITKVVPEGKKEIAYTEYLHSQH